MQLKKLSSMIVFCSGKFAGHFSSCSTWVLHFYYFFFLIFTFRKTKASSWRILHYKLLDKTVFFVRDAHANINYNIYVAGRLCDDLAIADHCQPSNCSIKVPTPKKNLSRKGLGNARNFPPVVVAHR